MLSLESHSWHSQGFEQVRKAMPSGHSGGGRGSPFPEQAHSSGNRVSVPAGSPPGSLPLTAPLPGALLRATGTQLYSAPGLRQACTHFDTILSQ